MSKIKDGEEVIFDSAFHFMLSFYKKSSVNPCNLLGEEKGKQMIALIGEFYQKLEKQLPILSLKRDICQMEMDILAIQYEMKVKQDFLKKAFEESE